MLVPYCKVLMHDNKKFLIEPFLKLDNEDIGLSQNEYLSVSAEAYLFLQHKLDLLHKEPTLQYYVDENFLDVVQVNDIQIVDIPQQEYEMESELDKFKHHVCRIMFDALHQYINLSPIVLFRFFRLSHYFASKGIYITEENKEEQYLTIIQENDDEMLNKLSEYLDILEEYNKTDAIVDAYYNYTVEIDNATTEDEVKGIYDKYIEML